MKKILLIATGGTIASVKTEKGLTPGLLGTDLVRLVPEVENICSVDCLQLFNMDSTNIRPGHWLMIAETIMKNYDQYDGFVITHGTDTMAYTAAGLSYIIQNNLKPIVLTGSQISAEEINSDGRSNLRDALIYACDDDSHLVQIVFAGSVINGTRARKNYTKSYFAFGSINYPEIARVSEGKVIRYIEQKIDGELEYYSYINPSVALLKLIPGMNNKIFDVVIENHDGMIIEGFGVGGLPEYSDYYDQVVRAVNEGKMVVMTTQVSNEGSDLSVYRVGKKIKSEVNILEAHDMTSESAIAKLMWILGQTSDFNKAKEMFYRTVNADILVK